MLKHYFFRSSENHFCWTISPKTSSCKTTCSESDLQYSTDLRWVHWQDRMPLLLLKSITPLQTLTALTDKRSCLFYLRRRLAALKGKRRCLIYSLIYLRSHLTALTGKSRCLIDCLIYLWNSLAALSSNRSCLNYFPSRLTALNSTLVCQCCWFAHSQVLVKIWSIDYCFGAIAAVKMPTLSALQVKVENYEI